MNKIAKTILLIFFVFPALVFAGLSKAFTDTGSAINRVWG